MARDENPPFARGETFDPDNIDSSDLGGDQLIGKEWVFEDVNPNSGVVRSNRSVRCRAVRNTSGIALLPKRLAKFSNTATAGVEYGQEVDGYATTTAAEGYPIDEYLPAAGVADDDIFWLVMEGPAVVLTALSDLAADVTPGDWMVNITGATSQSTTSGRLLGQVLTGATAALANQVQNRVGRALSAATTQNTNTDLLVDVGHW
jgi:hypothetical protein